MASVSEQHQENLNRLIDIIEVENSDGYGGKVDGERFMLWASQTYFQVMSDPPSIEQLLERKTDGRGDIGLDLHYIDEEDQVVYLVQSKFRARSTTVKRPEVDSFLQLPGKLFDQDVLGAVSNNDILDFAVTFRRHVENGFEVRLVYLTTERPTRQIGAVVTSWNDHELTLGQNQSVVHFAEVVGVADLLDTYSNPQLEPVVTSLKFTQFYESNKSGDNLRYLNGTISGDELVRVFNEHKFNIFQLNPRGPLGNTNVNKDIRKTLADDVERRRFYFLNNGLTAVCEAYRVDENGQARITDFQIVNGCQTTWNIYDHARRGGSLEGVSVNIKLIEVPAPADTLSVSISQASNSQSQMKDWDFLFNEQEQIRLQREFERIRTPLFYELKRGEQRFISATRLPKTTIKDVAQAAWAFIGYPSEAKDRLRELPRFYKSSDSAYRRVFFDGVTAQHLFLPLQVHNRVKQEWKEAAAAQGRSSSGRDAGDARLHIVWLIGKIVIRAANVEEYKDIDRAVLTEIISRIDDWFSDASAYAKYAVEDAHEFIIQSSSGTVSVRQLYRSREYYTRFSTMLDRALRNEFNELQNKMLGR